MKRFVVERFLHSLDRLDGEEVIDEHCLVMQQMIDRNNDIKNKLGIEDTDKEDLKFRPFGMLEECEKEDEDLKECEKEDEDLKECKTIEEAFDLNEDEVEEQYMISGKQQDPLKNAQLQSQIAAARRAKEMALKNSKPRGKA